MSLTLGLVALGLIAGGWLIAHAWDELSWRRDERDAEIRLRCVVAAQRAEAATADARSLAPSKRSEPYPWPTLGMEPAHDLFGGQLRRQCTHARNVDRGMSVCCELAKHLWALIAHHSGHRPKVTQEALANLTLYSTARRQVKAEPVNNRKAP